MSIPRDKKIRRTLLVLLLPSLIFPPGLAYLAAEPPPAKVQSVLKIHFDSIPDSGPILPDPKIPGAIIEMSDRVFSLYQRGDVQKALEAMTPLMAWIEANLPRLSPHAARSRGWLALLFTVFGRHQEALTQQELAVQIRRELFKADPAELDKLAGQLELLGENYATAGRLREAFAQQQEAVALRRKQQQVTQDPSQLATSLMLMGNRYIDLGMSKDALAVSEEATAFMREYIKTNPSKLRSMLFFQMILQFRYASAGLKQQALSRSEDSVRLTRKLLYEGKARPGDYAFALNVNATLLIFLKQSQDAIRSQEEALRIYSDLAKTNPEYLDDKASSLSDLAALYSWIGSFEKALPLAQEAVSVQRMLSMSRPASPDLFTSMTGPHIQNRIKALSNLGAISMKMVEYELARSAFEELLSVLRPFATTYREEIRNTKNSLEDLNRKENIRSRGWRELAAGDLTYLPKADPSTRVKRSVVRLWPSFSEGRFGIGQVVGTGFVVRREGDRAWIATALHVVRHPDDHRMATKIEAELFAGLLPPGLVPPRLEVAIVKSSIPVQGGEDLILLEVRGLPADVQPLPLMASPPQGPLTVVGHPSDGEPWRMISYSMLKASPVLLLDGKLDEGASGSPVLTPSGQVAGLVYRSSGEEDPVGLVYAYPARTIQEKLP